ncbi:MAG: hypothetical protein ABH877_02745 [bacterium]
MSHLPESLRDHVMWVHEDVKHFGMHMSVGSSITRFVAATMGWVHEVDVAFVQRCSRPKAVYADAAAVAKKAGHKVYPVMWGRAQLLLGRVKAKRKAATGKTKVVRKQAARKRVGRPRGRRTSTPATAAITVPDADIDTARDVVEALNAGGKAVLRFDGKAWVLAVE